MTSFDAVLMVAALLCSLVAGLLFAFATVVMPGFRYSISRRSAINLVKQPRPPRGEPNLPAEPNT